MAVAPKREVHHPNPLYTFKHLGEGPTSSKKLLFAVRYLRIRISGRVGVQEPPMFLIHLQVPGQKSEGSTLDAQHGIYSDDFPAILTRQMLERVYEKSSF